jgi:hypothetical protein
VERDNLEAARKELRLTTFGLTDPSSAVQIGRWVKADFAIKGVFVHPVSKPSHLLVEVIDLERADVLGKRLVRLGERTDDKLPADDASLEQFAEAVRGAIADAIAEKERSRNQTIVATLHFQNGIPANRLDFFENDMMEVFADANGTQDRVRFVQFPRAADAMEEADLIAEGLVTEGEDAWRRIADYYVWGSYQEVNSSGVAFEQVPVEATICVWDGGERLDQFTLQSTVGELGRLAKDVVKELLALPPPKREGTIDASVRKKIARELADRAGQLQEWLIDGPRESYPNIPPKWYAMWEKSLQLLSTAAFLDPTSDEIRSELLVETFRGDLDSYVPFHRRLFWRTWHRSRAWRAYCGRFGFGFRLDRTPKLTHRPGLTDNRLFRGTAMQNYVSSAADIMVATAERSASRGFPGRPDDVPPDLLARWHQDLAEEFVRRLEQGVERAPDEVDLLCRQLLDTELRRIDSPALRARAINAAWPLAVRHPNYFRPTKYDDWLRRTFSLIGQPERAEELLSEAAKVTRPPRPTVRRQGHTPPTPRVPDEPLAPLVTVSTTPVSFERWVLPHRVRAIDFVGGRLWTSLEGQWMSSLHQGHPLLVWDPGEKSTSFFVRNALRDLKVSALLEHAGKLWMALGGDGLWCLDLQTDQLQQYGERDGLPSEQMYAICAAGDVLFVAGGPEQKGVVGSFNPGTGQWKQYELPGYEIGGRRLATARVTQLAADDRWLAAYAHVGGSMTQALIMDRSTRECKDVAGRLMKQRSQFSHFESSARLIVNGLAIDDQLIWIASTRGLIGYDPSSDRFDVLLRTPYSLTALAQDGDDLWIGGFPFTGNYSPAKSTAEGACLFRYHCPSRSWVAQANLPHKGIITAMAIEGETLWLGMAGNGSTVVRVDLATMKPITPL